MPQTENTENEKGQATRLLALLSACGISASLAIYAESFLRPRADIISLWWVVLILGWMALFIPIYALEYPESRSPSFAWKGFARGTPKWVAPCSWLLAAIAVLNFAWFAAHAGWGVPEIHDGQYVLNARGHVLKVLTQLEYFQLRAAEARLFATTMIYFYFLPLMYWWFRPSQKLTV
jgi:hypothetical protein